MYSEEELRRIRAVISGEMSEDELKATGIYAALNSKLKIDENFHNFGLYCFFPESYEMLYGQKKDNLTISKCGETRGIGIILKNSEKQIVIKPVQIGLQCTKPEDADEIETAKFAGSINFGPKQYETLRGYITEEFLEGPFFPKMLRENPSDEKLYLLGAELGSGLKKMHDNNFYYNDTILADDIGKSHCIITSQGLKLIDFGAAVNLKNHPNYTDEQVFNYARTLPGSQFFIYSNPSQNELNEFILQFRREMNLLSKDEILARDEHFVKEGAFFAAMNYSRNMQPLMQGFKEKYN